MGIPDIQAEEYNYDLPHDFIALRPAESRDASRLLVMRKEGLSDDLFRNLLSYLPSPAVMVFNETRVVQARLPFIKESGAGIEVFCLEPLKPLAEVYSALSCPSPVEWRCMVGNAKKWKAGDLKMNLQDGIILYAEYPEREEQTFRVRFRWTPESLSFGEVLEKAGQTPLPPYIHRPAEENDKDRYQTVFARNSGSVAAPTAGLHFTPQVMAALGKSGIESIRLSLHVGAGTFKPLANGGIRSHHMHTEQLSVPVSEIIRLRDSLLPVIAVGTTSVRTIESLFWFGVKLHQGYKEGFSIQQWDPYQLPTSLSRRQALDQVIGYCNRNRIDELRGTTSLMIVPGYRFMITDILLTNFHQPKSSLLLLVAAFAGNRWRDAYSYALNNKFRFLSYGDACLFFKDPPSSPV